jgi:chromosome segregation ATPase
MGNYKIDNKIIVAIIIINFLFAGCQKKETVSRELYMSLLNEYANLKSNVEDARESNIQQAQVISATVMELSEIDINTLTLKDDIEDGSACMTQAEQISQRISAVKDRIADLEHQLENKDQTYVRMVKELTDKIELRERTIDSLKTELAKQREILETQRETISIKTHTIDRHEQTISQQRNTISTQEAMLQQLVSRQAVMLNQAGRDFETIADQEPEISRKKNRRKVDDWAANIYRMSIKYYRSAEVSGHSASSSDRQRAEQKLFILLN